MNVRMKRINKGKIPNRLAIFKHQNPDAKWEKGKNDIDEAFRCNRARYNELQQALRTEQGNLCAYCEIDLIAGTNGKPDDCRVEHFHPKSKREPNEPNWALKWDNLLAVCCGGNNSEVADPTSRYSADPKEYTCDVPKKNKILDNLIINPLSIPQDSCWNFNRSTGEILPNEDKFQNLQIPIDVANRTISELNLNGKRIRDQRKSLFNDLTDRIGTYLEEGMTIPEAREYIARAILVKNNADDWPSFFTLIRFILSSQAEEVIAVYGNI
jgi:uncharacterized protein (TIGR02646 family)